MTDRLSAEDRAERWWKAHVNSPTTMMTNEKWRTNVGALIHHAEKATAEAEREPITDKSICQRGHPKACWVEKQEWKGESDAVPGREATWTVAPYCSACTQLEAELKPLREALENQARRHDSICRSYDRNWGCTCGAKTAQEALRQNRG